MTATPAVDDPTTLWSIRGTWFVRISWNDYDENHRYGYSEWYKVNKAHGAEKEWAEKTYGAGSRNSAVAYQLSMETVKTVETFFPDGRVKTSVVTTEVTDFAPVYREFDEYNTNVLMPQAKYEKARVDSGEAALWDAHIAESNENDRRRQNGEAPVYDAEKAFYTFMGYSIPVRDDEVQPTAPKQGFLTRLFQG